MGISDDEVDEDDDDVDDDVFVGIVFGASSVQQQTPVDSCYLL